MKNTFLPYLCILLAGIILFCIKSPLREGYLADVTQDGFAQNGIKGDVCGKRRLYKSHKTVGIARNQQDSLKMKPLQKNKDRL